MTTTKDETMDTNVTTIQEGTATMKFPADQESTVFYNPVQVQNRDLSILMISLFGERRVQRKAIKQKRKELHKLKLSKEESAKQLEDFTNNLNVAELLEKEKDADDASGMTILDALAASGLRSIRYWKEIPGVKHVTINDMELAATDRAKDNLQNNNLSDVLLESNVDRAKGICINHGDATHEMYMSRRPQLLRNPNPIQQKQQPMWDVIDLDPYGSAAPFLDGAVQAIESGGLLCCTCTDMAALGGSHPETAYGRYAALPIQSSRYLQELALRILLHTIAVSAAKYGRTIRPILSVGMAFYVRVFVEIHNDKAGVNDLSLNIGHVYQSTQCSNFVTLPHGQMGGKKGRVYQSIRLTPSVCPDTGASFKVGGPMWLGPLHDKTVLSTALERLSHEKGSSPSMEYIATRKRLQGLLTSCVEELDTPLYYTLSNLCRTLHCNSPPLQTIKAAIVNAGYNVSGYHKEPEAIKTDAPSDVIWDIFRAWIKEHPNQKPPPENSAAAKILSKEPSIQVDFSVPKAMKQKAKAETVSRFPQNPEKHWGPKRRATNKRKADEDNDGDEKTKNESSTEEPDTKRTNVAEEDKKQES